MDINVNELSFEYNSAEQALNRLNDLFSTPESAPFIYSDRIKDSNSFDSFFIDFLKKREIKIIRYSYHFDRTITESHTVTEKFLKYSNDSAKKSLLLNIDKKISKSLPDYLFENSELYSSNIIKIYNKKSFIFFYSVELSRLFEVIQYHFFDGYRFFIFPMPSFDLSISDSNKYHEFFYEITLGADTFNKLHLQYRNNRIEAYNSINISDKPYN